MPSSRKLSSALALFLLALWAVNGQVARSEAAQQTAPDRKHVSAGGEQTFASSCAGCHGLDGRGGERAPNIASRPAVQQLSDADLMRIIQQGIMGTGMPPFHSLQTPEVKAVVAYLRKLQGTGNALKLPGNPERGKPL